MFDPRITPTVLRQLISYDPETGAMVWRERGVDITDNHQGEPERFNTKFAGKQCLCTLKRGYMKGKVFNTALLAHRVAWAIHYGEWPSGPIDHINGVPSDNRIANLRVVTISENGRNMKRSSRNRSGTVGVRWQKAMRRWVAYICNDKRQCHLGSFRTEGEAIAARKAAERRFGYHGNHGRAF